MHEKGDFRQEQLRGKKRQDLAEKLEHQKPARVAGDMAALSSKKALKKGNNTGVPSSHIVRQIGYKVKQRAQFALSNRQLLIRQSRQSISHTLQTHLFL